MSNIKRKAAVAGGTGLGVLMFPALAPWGIYRTVQWVHGQILEALEGTNEFNFEELREMHMRTKSHSGAKVESLRKNRSWFVPDLVEPWDKTNPNLLGNDEDNATGYSFMEPNILSTVEKDSSVSLKPAKEINDEPNVDNAEFVGVWRKDGMKLE